MKGEDQMVELREGFGTAILFNMTMNTAVPWLHDRTEWEHKTLTLMETTRLWSKS